VAQCLARFEAAQLSWPEAARLDEATLESLLYPPPVPAAAAAPRAVPEWSHVHRELCRKGVTLTLLWQEYKAASPNGYPYSWFCDQYRSWAQRLDVVMR
jgi:transposase